MKSQSAITLRRVVYNKCCKGGKVYITPFKKPSLFLSELLRYNGPPRSKEFIKKIRQYNCLFAFTSMGTTVDRSVNDGNGPNIYKINGQVCHRMGSLMPKKGNTPKYAELYIYDTQNEIKNRIQALDKGEKGNGALDESIVEGLMHMLDAHNSFVKTFRSAREILEANKHAEIAIRLIAPGESDSPQFSLPATDELASLMFGEFTVETSCRDIIIHGRDDNLQQISSLQTSYMPLQYPLLFPYAERGFQLGIRYIGSDPLDTTKRTRLTMLDYYSYCLHYRPEQHNPYLCCGLLSSQAIVDARACIDEWRLHFIMKANNDLRAENLQGVTDAVGKGQTDAGSVGKKNILPSSFTGGRRYMVENFQDAVAISRVFGPPDLFTTFTCNPKWGEIAEALSSEPGQMPSDRADLPVRVYHMKLNDYLHDIKSGEAFGPVVAGNACFTITPVSFL